MPLRPWPEQATGVPRSMAAIVLAGSIGTVIEWYDFLIYGTAAALLFNTLFFPRLDPSTGTLAALGTFAVGFLARPLGGALFGHFGDRVGRKAMLLVTMATMALGTFGIGLLPTYGQIGLWAPILLVALRVVQGIGLGGEWGGASLVVLEHAPAGGRGLYGSLVQVGFPLGLIASSGAFALAGLLPEAVFRAWGWRVPFLASAVLLLVGWFVRARVPETPHFERLRRHGSIARSPVREVLLRDTRALLVAVGLKLSEVSWVYILTVFVVIYGTATLRLPKALLLDAILIASAIELVTIPAFGWLSDMVGRRIFYVLGALFTAGFGFPLFWMLDTKDPATVTLAIVVALSLGHGAMFGVQSTYFPKLFPARVRYTGASLGFQVAAALGGGLSPILATSLAATFGGTAGVSVLLIILAAITLTGALLARETRRDPLPG
ncbi:MAG: MHS family MFS transporter [Pseudomonadota bacterium]|nr:MHS family MFS transporter [Pseudomonadota bacterium]